MARLVNTGSNYHVIDINDFRLGHRFNAKLDINFLFCQELKNL